MGGGPERASCSCASAGGLRSGRRARRPIGAYPPWAVTIRLTPENVLAGVAVDQRETWDIAVAAAAAVRSLAWDRKLLDRFLADAAPALATDPPQGFATMWSPAYRVYAIEPALQPADAECAVAATFTPPSGFRVDYSARPADLSELDRLGAGA